MLSNLTQRNTSEMWSRHFQKMDGDTGVYSSGEGKCEIILYKGN